MGSIIVKHESLSLLTDLYQLSMAYGYWKTGRANLRSIFHLSYRSNPFHGGYAVCAGLQLAMDYVTYFRFDIDDVAYLAELRGNDQKPLFENDFLRYLSELQLNVEIDAIAEGTFVFAHEPLMRVSGPILHCQLLETALLNILNFQTLIATKANRVVRAAGGDTVLEFGLRRAQGIDGGIAASRASYVGGCHATSNVLAGKKFNIPVKGTHAHSWVMSFDDELDAFSAYADAMPNNCIFLVDTYDTLEGVRNAVRVGRKLRDAGHKMVGIRLDSGDLAYLSIKAREMLDESGLTEAVIVASNDLDERLIVSLKSQGAKISVWGIGTKLVTAYDQPALGGVYKLSAIQNEDGTWTPKIKLSEQTAKASIPGKLQVRRYFTDREARADMIYNELVPPQWDEVEMVDPTDALTRKRGFPGDYQELLSPVFRNGQQIDPEESLRAIRERTLQQDKLFHHSILRFDNPHRYPVGLESGLYDLKAQMIVNGRASKGK
jgi:nicotinate phosphoribosyltransferase